MKRMNQIAVTLLLMVSAGYAKEPGTAGQYTWEKERIRYSLSSEEDKLPELMLKSHVQYDYTFENDEFVMYSTHHRIVYVNSNEAIQKHNRIFISMSGAATLKAVKARSISRSGKVVYFDESNLKEIKEEESGAAYRIFAMEGVEIGSEVEYLYTRKMAADVFNGEYMQFDMPTKVASMRLSSPRHLRFDFRSYNGLPQVQQLDDTTMNVYEVVAKSIDALREEPFSSSVANRKKIEYKLAYNTARSKARLYTWEDAAKRFYEVLTTVTKDDLKAVEKFVKTAKDDKTKDLDTRIRKIESIVKTSIAINKEGGDEPLGAPESILKVKVASKEGITKLYIAVFKQMGIEVHPVLTCSRERTRFDGDFDSWSFLDEYLLYFPQTQMFLAPYFDTRYPLIPGEYTAQKGLFIEPFEMGEVKSALGVIHEIPAADYLANQDNLDIDVRFDEGLESNTINQLRSFVGFTADYFATFHAVANEEKRKQMVEELIKETAADAQVTTWKARPVAKPKQDWFEIQGEFKTSSFIEKAGPRVLFKAGLLIGPQIEMYRDDKRTYAVENGNNRNYDRIIRIHIPAGYTVKNADQLNMDIRFNNEESNPYIFKSEHTLNGNLLEIRITEFYKEIYVPLEKYENFRKVVNASADFNKVTLVLEKVR
jgi:Domain of Unknown Function with PDB structure (DUF3857)